MKGVTSEEARRWISVLVLWTHPQLRTCAISWSHETEPSYIPVPPHLRPGLRILVIGCLSKCYSQSVSLPLGHLPQVYVWKSIAPSPEILKQNGREVC